MSRRILVSGFEPFGSRAVNPTARLIETLPEIARDFPAEVRGVVLPVAFASAFARLQAEIIAFQPDDVVALGLAGGRSTFMELERVAINCMDADIPDNVGAQPRGEEIEAGGAPAYFSTLPLRKLVAALTASHVPARVSNSAGTYVCNFLFYRLQELNVRSMRRSGFIHVPDLPAEASGGPSMNLSVMQEGLRTILRTLVAP